MQRSNGSLTVCAWRAGPARRLGRSRANLRDPVLRDVASVLDRHLPTMADRRLAALPIVGDISDDEILGGMSALSFGSLRGYRFAINRSSVPSRSIKAAIVPPHSWACGAWRRGYPLVASGIPAASQ